MPLQYLWRAPQLVIWSTARRRQQAVVATVRAESRREFLKGAAGVAGASGLLALGVSEKVVSFFKGPPADAEAESALLAKKLQRLQQTAEERALELERQRNDMILVARYADLQDAKGKYFIDYANGAGPGVQGQGRPAACVISAKCTHLGCTVGSELDTQGRIMCPCHISYFDVLTGKPNDGAPAKSSAAAIWPGRWWTPRARSWSAKRPGPAAGRHGDARARCPKCSLYITKPRQEHRLKHLTQSTMKLPERSSRPRPTWPSVSRSRN